MVSYWSREPREAADAPSLKLFQVRLFRALSNLLKLQLSLLTLEGLD